MKPFSIQECYAAAWRSFKKWWIPLCLISGLILIFEIVPRILVYPETKVFKQFVVESVSKVSTALKDKDVQTLDAFVVEFQEKSVNYTVKLCKFSAVAFPFVALLTVILLMWANAAVKDHRENNTKGRTLYITVVHVFLSCVKMTAMLFCILPGVYIYVRMFFVSLIMLEDENCGMSEAIGKSWKMTKGNFWGLLTVFLINVTCQLFAGSTVIGLIPATGFVNTARAAAYQMLKPENKQIEGTA